MGINKKQSVTVGLLDPLLYSLHQANIYWRIYNIYWRRVALLDQLLWRPILSRCIPHSRGSQWGGEGDRQPSHYKRILAKMHFPQSKCPGWSLVNSIPTQQLNYVLAIFFPFHSPNICWCLRGRGLRHNSQFAKEKVFFIILSSQHWDALWPNAFLNMQLNKFKT